MRRVSKKELLLFLILVFTCLLLFFFDSQGWLRSARGLVEKPIGALQKDLYTFKVLSDRWLGPWQRRKDLESQMFDLQVELKRLAVEQNQVLSLLEENEKMRRLLGSPLPASWHFLPAQVIGFGEKLKLDQGEEEGVELGMMVVDSQVLLGRVTDLGQHQSLVQLITGSGVKIPVLVKRPLPSGGLGGVQARGLLFGGYGPKMSLEGALQEEDIQKGDLVVSAGEEGWLPDLVIGQISQVLPQSAQVHQKAQVTPLADFDSLITVFLVVP